MFLLFAFFPSPAVAICGAGSQASEQFCTLVQNTLFEPDNPFNDLGFYVTIFVPNTGTTIRNNNLLTDQQRTAINNVLGRNPTAANRRIVVDFLRLHTLRDAFTINGLCGTARPTSQQYPTLIDNEPVTVNCTTTRVTVQARNSADNAPIVDPADRTSRTARFHFIDNILSSRQPQP